MKQREELTVGALARAREQAAAAETKTREYEEAFQAARQEVYRQREEDRRIEPGTTRRRIAAGPRAGGVVDRTRHRPNWREKWPAPRRNWTARASPWRKRFPRVWWHPTRPPAGREVLTLNRKLRQAAWFALLGICLAGFAAPRCHSGAGGRTRHKEKKAPSRRTNCSTKSSTLPFSWAGSAYLLRKPLAEFFSFALRLHSEEFGRRPQGAGSLAGANCRSWKKS